jgi:Ser/Thr protein kinase RdoA (MazF antagonist)
VTPPRAVLAAWGWEDAEVTALSGGLINATYRIGDRIAVLQRLHPVFGPAVNLDLEAVTAHLAAHGLVTPRLVRTRDGRAWVEDDGRPWRALTWVDGETVHRVPDPAWAEAAGELVGRFHRAVADLHHDYAFARTGVHDTAAHLARLADEARRHADDAEGAALAHDILAAAARLPPLPALPRRHCHGDLKISNILFAQDPLRAVCLVDLDTLGLSTIAFELGDAMRSWCNPNGEDAGGVVFDRGIYDAAIRGLRATASDVISPVEYDAIALGRQTVCIELAARFCVDVFRDEYFGWDPARFPSRRAHNLVRARGQLALGLLS